MKIFVVIVAVFVASCSAARGDENVCHDAVLSSCSGKTTDVYNCNALHGGFIEKESNFHKLVVAQIEKSFEYLLLATNFDTHVKNRPGFTKLFQKLSDSAWDRSLDDIRYISQRGGRMNFANRDPCVEKNLDTNEIDAIAIALDSQKDLAIRVNKVIESVSHANNEKHFDAAAAHALEEKYFGDDNSLTEMIRYLSGNIHDLDKMIKGTSDPSLALYLYDEFLQKAS